MSGLLGNLSSAARALEAQRYGLEVTGQNIANANTVGYTRREALFAAVPGVTRLSAGNGVDILGVRAVRDARLDQRLLQELPTEQREAALAAALSVVETAIGAPGASIDRAMNMFFDAWSRLSAEPTSAIARQEVASEAAALGTAFRDMAGRLELARRDADAGIRAGVEQVNALAQQIASINAALGKAPAGGGESLHLRDQLTESLKALSSLLDIDTIPRADGGVDVAFANGSPLVIGANAYTIEIEPGDTLGLATLMAQGRDVSNEITGGRIGGLLHARETLIPGYLARLDTLAHAIATEVNRVHRQGYDPNGHTEIDFFTPIGDPAGAASRLTLDEAIARDPGKIAAAAGVGGGDNRIARELSGLREQRLLPAGTFADAWAQLVYRVGADSRAAQNEQRSRSEIVRQVDMLREQVSGVSLDEEAMLLMKFQRAYEANARYFQAIDRALDTLMQALGR